MTENEIYKSIQKAMEKPPLILVGSGGSAPYDILLALAHRFSFSSCHKKSASCDINSILSQLADFLQTFFQRLITLLA